MDRNNVLRAVWRKSFVMVTSLTRDRFTHNGRQLFTGGYSYHLQSENGFLGLGPVTTAHPDL